MQVRLWAENLLYYVLFISIGIHAGNASKYEEFRNPMRCSILFAEFVQKE